MKNMGFKRVCGFFIFLGVFAGVSAIIMLLWNALIPAIIGWSVINYWQAAGLLILCRLLLGGFGKMRHAGAMFHHHHGAHHEKMKHMHNQMKGMSHEDRRAYIRERMGGFDNCNPWSRNAGDNKETKNQPENE